MRHHGRASSRQKTAFGFLAIRDRRAVRNGKIGLVRSDVEEVVERLRMCGVALDPGLAGDEFDTVRKQFGFEFSPDHRSLLALALPIGQSWPDWRSGDHDDLASRLAWPADGVVFDVLNNAFWPASWGRRPADDTTAEAITRVEMARVPTLIPIYSHRYLPAAPAPVGSPVFSVYQTDVIYYGDNLLDYVAHEFHIPPPHPTGGNRPRVRFWSDLAESVDDADL